MSLVVAATLVAAGLAGALPARAYVEAPVPDAGSLSGTVRFVGTPPALEPIVVTTGRGACGDRKPSEALVLGPDHGVKGAVVMIRGITRGKRRQGEIVLDNAGCVFVPHVTAAMVGTPARVTNSDATLHSARGVLGKTTVFNLALPGRAQTIDITRRLTEPGVIRVLCDSHLHMLAWIVLHDSPYVAVTDDRGTFRLEGVPPGTYKVAMWHEGFRRRRQDREGRPAFEEPRTAVREVRIGPSAAATVDFELRELR